MNVVSEKERHGKPTKVQIIMEINYARFGFAGCVIFGEASFKWYIRHFTLYYLIGAWGFGVLFGITKLIWRVESSFSLEVASSKWQCILSY